MEVTLCLETCILHSKDELSERRGLSQFLSLSGFVGYFFSDD